MAVVVNFFKGLLPPARSVYHAVLTQTAFLVERGEKLQALRIFEEQVFCTSCSFPFHGRPEYLGGNDRAVVERRRAESLFGGVGEGWGGGINCLFPRPD